MALPILKTSDRVRLVYTGDPSIRGNTKPHEYEWRAATPDDVVKGASVAVVRSLSKTEHKQAHIAGNGNAEAFLLELLARGLCAIEGDSRPPMTVIEEWPMTPVITLGNAIDKLSSDTDDPFGQRSSG